MNSQRYRSKPDAGEEGVLFSSPSRQKFSTQHNPQLGGYVGESALLNHIVCILIQLLTTYPTEESSASLSLFSLKPSEAALRLSTTKDDGNNSNNQQQRGVIINSIIV
jgi:hypothetical protein